MAEELAFIPPDVLPREFGGEAPLIPVDEAVRRFGIRLGGAQANGLAKVRLDVELQEYYPSGLE